MTALPLALAAALALSATSRARPPGLDAGPEAAPAAPAAPLGDAELQDRVRAYLDSIDTPIRAEQWRALGPGAVPALQQVVNDKAEMPGRRAKALGALGVLGGPAARKTVLGVARSDGEAFAVRATALHAAGRIVPAKELARELKPVLETAKEPLVRSTAAEVLAARAPRSACAAVRAQAAREPQEERARFDGALQRCGPAGK